MAYRIVSGRPLAQEIQRLLDQELRDAISGLTQSTRAGDGQRVHDTRKHIKKARALLQVARRPLGRSYAEKDDLLRTASRALGALADAHRASETLEAVCREGVVPPPAAALPVLRARLASRAAALGEEAVLEDIRQRVVRLLDSARKDVVAADLENVDRAAIITELRVVHAASRKARRRAHRQPSDAAYHRWRRRVKREWHLFRLIAELTGGRMKDEQHQLAALDACLGELHDIDVLIGVVAVNSPLSRTELARVIRALRVHQRDLRRLSRRLSAVLDERPDVLVKRVRVLWGASPRHAETVHQWQHSA